MIAIFQGDLCLAHSAQAIQSQDRGSSRLGGGEERGNSAEDGSTIGKKVIVSVWRIVDGNVSRVGGGVSCLLGGEFLDDLARVLRWFTVRRGPEDTREPLC